MINVFVASRDHRWLTVAMYWLTPRMIVVHSGNVMVDSQDG